jgi:hypothetical protein
LSMKKAELIIEYFTHEWTKEIKIIE